MIPDEWTDALDAESGHADPTWARQARRLAWQRRRAAELGEAMTRRPLIRLVLVSALSSSYGLLFLLPDAVMPVALPLVQVLELPGLSLLLLLVWQARYVQLGYAPWALAAVSGVWNLGLAGLFVATASSTPPDFAFSRMALTVLGHCTFVSLLLTVFGWSLKQIRFAPERRPA